MVTTVSGNTVVTVVTLVNRENGSKIAYFLHSTHTVPPDILGWSTQSKM